ncbi:MAG: hypothetical protein WCF18_12655 [Chthoniobacteraceae bacterium]
MPTILFGMFAGVLSDSTKKVDPSQKYRTFGLNGANEAAISGPFPEGGDGAARRAVALVNRGLTEDVTVTVERCGALVLAELALAARRKGSSGTGDFAVNQFGPATVPDSAGRFDRRVR